METITNCAGLCGTDADLKKVMGPGAPDHIDGESVCKAKYNDYEDFFKIPKHSID